MNLLLRGATLVDGTGSSPRRADVAVSGDRIEAVAPPGELTPPEGTEVVDLDGLVLAPGFIDVHTHYDAQILWDGDLTPSSWHGITSVIMGNCGFGVAPTRPEHRDLIVRTFENVEGMAMEALERGHRLALRELPRVPRGRRPAAQAPQRRRLRRPLHAAALRRRPPRGAPGHGRGARVDALAACARRWTQGRSGSRRRRRPAPPGRLRAPGAEPGRRARRGRRARVGAGRAREGRGGGGGGARPLARAVLRPLRDLRRPGDVDGAVGQDGARRCRPADPRTRRGAAGRGVPAGRLPADRRPDHDGRSDPARRGRRLEGGAGHAARRAGRPLPRSRVAGPGAGRHPRGLGPPVAPGRCAGDGRQRRHRRHPPRRPGRRSRHHAVRPHARPGARRPAGRPASASSWTTTTRRRSVGCSPTSARCSGCPMPAPTPASCATPASRPTCSATGYESDRRCRWRTPCGA